jgi:hypothetical protein
MHPRRAGKHASDLLFITMGSHSDFFALSIRLKSPGSISRTCL